MRQPTPCGRTDPVDPAAAPWASGPAPAYPRAPQPRRDDDRRRGGAGRRRRRQRRQRRGDLGSRHRLVPQRRPSGDAALRPAQRRGHARPRDRPRPRQRAPRRLTQRGVDATPETPFCVYSTSKAITAFVIHKLCERGLLELDDPVAKHIPGYERNGKGRITIGHVLAHRAGVPNLPTRGARPRPHRRPRVPREALCDAKPLRSAGKPPRLPRGLGRLHPRRGRLAGHRQGHPRRARRGVPRSARLPLDQLRRRRRRRERGRRQLRHRPADGAAALQPAQPRARDRARRSRRADQRPAVPDRDRPRGQHGHDRQRALALLRGHALRRRARRGPGDRARDDPQARWSSSPTSRSISRSASRPASPTG